MRQMTDRIDDRLERLYAIGGGEGANRPGFSEAEDEAIELAASWMAEAGLDVSTVTARQRHRAARRRGAEAARGLDGLASRLGARGREVRRRARRRGGPRGGRAPRPPAADARRRRLPRRGDRLPRQPRVRLLRAAAAGRVRRGAHRAGPAARRRGRRARRGQRHRRLLAPHGVTFEGVAGHAGTTPMAARDDALVKAAQFVLRARDAAGDAVATVGQLEVEPGAVNVIPGRVTLSLDLRAPDGDRLERSRVSSASSRRRGTTRSRWRRRPGVARRAARAARHARARARLVGRPRRGRARRGRRAERDALRAQPRRGRQPHARRVLEPRGRRAGGRRAPAARWRSSALAEADRPARPPRGSTARAPSTAPGPRRAWRSGSPRAARPCSRSCSSRTGTAARSRSARPGRGPARRGAGSWSRSRGRRRGRGRPTGSSSTRRSSGSG